MSAWPACGSGWRTFSSKEENINDIINKLKIIFSNRIFIRNLNDARNNWLELPIEEVLKKIYIFLEHSQVLLYDKRLHHHSPY